MEQRLWVGLCLVGSLAVASGATDSPGKVKAAAVTEATLEIYKTKCQSCHMPDGAAPLEMMNLADANWKHGSKPADVVKVITEGVPNTAMLPFKEQLTPAEIAGLAAYVRSFDKTLKPGGKAKK
jgi:mono/diheme cytochrome c family protein